MLVDLRSACQLCTQPSHTHTHAHDTTPLAMHKHTHARNYTRTFPLAGTQSPTRAHDNTGTDTLPFVHICGHTQAVTATHCVSRSSLELFPRAESRWGQESDLACA